MPSRDPARALQTLLRTMEILRSPQGCPWDTEQTPRSLAPYILEEACELIEAIETGGRDQIRDELGDLLLQVVFQTQIFAESGDFDFADVAEAINAKLLRRHPHVFGGHKHQMDSRDLDRQWEQIKQGEKIAAGQAICHAGHLPRQLPALQRAQKLVSRMRKSGQADLLTADLLTHLPAPATSGGSQQQPRNDTKWQAETRFGQELLQVVMRAEQAGVDAEQALRHIIHLITQGLAVEPG